MQKKCGIHCFISGRVQGVFFRAHTQETAQLLGLTGWAKNLPDGRVEVMAFGPQEKLKMLEKWLHKGPASARVDNVTANEIEFTEMKDFTTG